MKLLIERFNKMFISLKLWFKCAFIVWSIRLEEEKLVTAEGLYKKAIALDDTFHEAKEALRKLQLHIQVSCNIPKRSSADVHIYMNCTV